jgi:CO/xanthine dehydrogenase Mo-binding subunit
MKLPYEPRFEDQRLLTGAGHFVDDEAEAGRAYGVFVRSPHAFADIRAIDTIAARVQPGVIAVLTARDMEREGVGNLTIPPRYRVAPGSSCPTVPRWPETASVTSVKRWRSSSPTPRPRRATPPNGSSSSMRSVRQ